MQQVMNPRLKKTLKICLAAIASVLGLLLLALACVLWFVLTPSRLTPVVEAAANKYLDADIKVGKVDVTFFSSFPRLTLVIDDGHLVVHGAADTSGGRKPMPHRDSLLQFARCRITVSPMPYLKDNKVVIHRILLDSARVYAWKDASGRANWNFIPYSENTMEPDTVTAGVFRPDAIVLRSL